MIQQITVNALITEDDPLNSSMLSELLQDHFPKIQLLGICGSVQETRQFLRGHTIDLLFLDMELPDGLGFNVLNKMPELKFEVIVTTSYSKYTLEAIRHSALDYLLKPVKISELTTAIESFYKRRAARTTSKSFSSPGKPAFHKLPLPTVEGFVFVNTDDIIHAEAERAYASFSLRNGKKILVSKPLGEFEERLLNQGFFRIHNSHIVNLNEINKYVKGEGGHVILSNDELVPVSRSRKDEFLRLTGNY